MSKTNSHQFDIVSIFPGAIEPYLQTSILGKAQKKKLLKLAVHDLRKWTKDKHHTVDDTPYGGGPGMVMKVEPFDLAVTALKKKAKKKRVRVILTSASGKKFTQRDAKRLSKYDQLIFLCGRYEGVDFRVEEQVADEALSIGPYVLTGGELPALVIVDAIVRLIPGVLGKKESLLIESHDQEGYLEYPHYTKPEIYHRWNVPPVLLSGNHKAIQTWREGQAKKTTG